MFKTRKEVETIERELTKGKRPLSLKLVRLNRELESLELTLPFPHTPDSCPECRKVRMESNERTDLLREKWSVQGKIENIATDLNSIAHDKLRPCKVNGSYGFKLSNLSMSPTFRQVVTSQN